MSVLRAGRMFSNGQFRSITIKDGKAVGEGEFVFDGHCLYASCKGTFDWESLRLNGTGRLMRKDGIIIEGTFVNGELEGKGTTTWDFGLVYEGEFVKGARHGKGTMTWPDGRVYEGDWVKNVQHGKCTFTWANGDVFEGDWVKSKKHGKGTFTWANGDSFEGDWVDDKKHGTGLFRYADGRYQRRTYTEDKRTSSEAAVELPASLLAVMQEKWKNGGGGGAAKKRKRDDDESAPTCTVCMDSSSDWTLPCGHLFCKGCIDGMCGSGRTLACPTCRKGWAPGQPHQVFL